MWGCPIAEIWCRRGSKDSEEELDEDGIPENVQGLRRQCWQMLQSSKFQAVIVALIMFNTILMASEHSDRGNNMNATYTAFLDMSNMVLTIAFCIESGFKLMVLGPRHFADE